MDNYNVIIDQLGLDDLAGIYKYFAEQLFIPTVAVKTVKKIENEINYNLSFSPYYPLVDNKRLAKMGFRKMVVKKYLVFFVIDEENNIVTVRRIIHGARKWKRVLLEET